MSMDGKMQHWKAVTYLQTDPIKITAIFFSWKLTTYSKIYMEMQRDKKSRHF